MHYRPWFSPLKAVPSLISHATGCRVCSQPPEGNNELSRVDSGGHTEAPMFLLQLSLFLPHRCAWSPSQGSARNTP